MGRGREGEQPCLSTEYLLNLLVSLQRGRGKRKEGRGGGGETGGREGMTEGKKG